MESTRLSGFICARQLSRSEAPHLLNANRQLVF